MSQPRKTILIVEDDFYNMEYLKELLSATANLLLARNGLEAIELAMNDSIDLVLMDIRLPDMNGYDVTRRILLKNPLLKIIAQTGYASYEDQAKAIEAGCSDYVSKPIRKDTLLTMINKHLA